LLKRQIDKAPAGPDEKQRCEGSSRLWGQVRNAKGETLASRLETSEPYLLTAHTAWDIAKRTTAGEGKAGFQTPSQVFGADYILSFPKTSRTDL